MFICFSKVVDEALRSSSWLKPLSLSAPKKARFRAWLIPNTTEIILSWSSTGISITLAPVPFSRGMNLFTATSEPQLQTIRFLAKMKEALGPNMGWMEQTSSPWSAPSLSTSTMGDLTEAMSNTSPFGLSLKIWRSVSAVAEICEETAMTSASFTPGSSFTLGNSPPGRSSWTLTSCPREAKKRHSHWPMAPPPPTTRTLRGRIGRGSRAWASTDSLTSRVASSIAAASLIPTSFARARYLSRTCSSTRRSRTGRAFSTFCCPMLRAISMRLLIRSRIWLSISSVFQRMPSTESVKHPTSHAQVRQH